MSDNLVSAPTDSSAVSFLDLPAEIRNYIYTEVYEHVDPIVVTNFGHGSGRIKLHRRLGDRNHKFRYGRPIAPKGMYLHNTRSSNE